jgi:hypothetical protein
MAILLYVHSLIRNTHKFAATLRWCYAVVSNVYHERPVLINTSYHVLLGLYFSHIRMRRDLVIIITNHYDEQWLPIDSNRFIANPEASAQVHNQILKQAARNARLNSTLNVSTRSTPKKRTNTSSTNSNKSASSLTPKRPSSSIGGSNSSCSKKRKVCSTHQLLITALHIMYI